MNGMTVINMTPPRWSGTVPAEQSRLGDGRSRSHRDNRDRFEVRIAYSSLPAVQ
jgi:hypothetical protein